MFVASGCGQKNHHNCVYVKICVSSLLATCKNRDVRSFRLRTEKSS
jgi:hypothetical protein